MMVNKSVTTTAIMLISVTLRPDGVETEGVVAAHSGSLAEDISTSQLPSTLSSCAWTKMRTLEDVHSSRKLIN